VIFNIRFYLILYRYFDKYSFIMMMNSMKKSCSRNFYWIKCTFLFERSKMKYWNNSDCWYFEPNGKKKNTYFYSTECYLFSFNGLLLIFIQRNVTYFYSTECYLFLFNGLLLIFIQRNVTYFYSTECYLFYL